MMIYNDNENNLADCISNIASFDIFSNGEKTTYNFDEIEFLQILNNIKNLFSNSRLMPAFGVSLHNETLNEMKDGKWLQINFNKEQSKNGLCFNALLFKLEKVQGFNLIRLYNNHYEGRCLYLDLDNPIDLTNWVQQKFNLLLT